MCDMRVVVDIVSQVFPGIDVVILEFGDMAVQALELLLRFPLLPTLEKHPCMKDVRQESVPTAKHATTISLEEPLLIAASGSGLEANKSEQVEHQSR